LAGRFAGKEAVIKCIGGINLTDMKKIEIRHYPNGAPYALIDDNHIQLSISHEINYTVAIALSQ
jgi:phosphopantetheinyl transferase (holo-ACP synthase)